MTDQLVVHSLCRASDSSHSRVTKSSLFGRFLSVFLILIYLYKISLRKKWPEGTVFAVFAFCLGLIVFALEFLKVYRVYLYGLSFRQLLALGIIALSIANIIRILNLFKKIYHKKLT